MFIIWTIKRLPLYNALRGFLATASVPVLLVLGVVALSVVGGGGLATYKAYDYVQHDSDFCLSCHLMEEPFAAFEQSAHRGLGCKACHQPNPIERAKMGLTQIISRPTEIRVHAEVPNERCVACHVDGDPEAWKIISGSRGHELHLNSAEIVDIDCVTCHSHSVHDFEATSASCGLAGCHDHVQIALGGMGELDLQCVACHNFVAPVPAAAAEAHDPDSLHMVPTTEDCLSCHEMRERVVVDEATEPHRALCGTCHNPHDQRRARDAEATCSDGLCHGRPTDVDDPHHQWRSVDLLACMQCHRAHDFTVMGDQCTDCHTEIPGG
ncbi:MAG TPA: NapC/NirT family cytochrome c [Longimicrobiales bacterium]|nr:NapC/NirT family cytochrome c [Longimicrobiales bacterium]